MHQFAFIVSSPSLSLSLSNKRSIHQSTRTYNTRANQKKRMDLIKQENQRLREKVTTLKGDLERLNDMVTTISHRSLCLQALFWLSQNTYVMPILTVFVSTLQHTMFEGYLWSTPFNFGEVLHPRISKVPVLTTKCEVLVAPLGTTFPQAAMTYSARPWTYLPCRKR